LSAPKPVAPWGRVAFVLDANNLPSPNRSCTSVTATNFNAAEEVLARPELKRAYKQALDQGVALIDANAE
jgi:hypothetical protein